MPLKKIQEIAKRD